LRRPRASALPISRGTCNVGVFFRHAEDGIRDRNLTGVQTCALPISAHGLVDVTRGLAYLAHSARDVDEAVRWVDYTNGLRDTAKIGRASRRERDAARGIDTWAQARERSRVRRALKVVTGEKGRTSIT